MGHAENQSKAAFRLKPEFTRTSVSWCGEELGWGGRGGGRGGHRGCHVAGLTPSLVISRSARESGGEKRVYEGGEIDTRGCAVCETLLHWGTVDWNTCDKHSACAASACCLPDAGTFLNNGCRALRNNAETNYLISALTSDLWEFSVNRIWLQPFIVSIHDCEWQTRSVWKWHKMPFSLSSF